MSETPSSTPEGTGSQQPGGMKPGDDAPPGTPGTGEDICPECQGSGQVEGHACPTCRGTGTVIKGIGGA